MIPAIPSIPSVGAAVAQAATQFAAAPAAQAASSGAAGAAGSAGSAVGIQGSAPAGSSGGSFANMLGSALDSLNTTQQTATNLSLQAATGNASIADVTVASTEASLQTQLVTAVRDKAVTAFTTIMNMQA